MSITTDITFDASRVEVRDVAAVARNRSDMPGPQMVADALTAAAQLAKQVGIGDVDTWKRMTVAALLSSVCPPDEAYVLETDYSGENV